MAELIKGPAGSEGDKPDLVSGATPTIVSQRCPQCDRAAPPIDNYCGNCGTKLAADPQPDTERVGDRRQLTVLFCDMMGSTEMAGRLDVEDYQEIVRLYQQTVSSAVTDLGGYIAQYLGDGVVAYFGWPVASGDDASRAVHAGLRIIEGLERVNRNLLDDRKIIPRVGVHTGRVVLGQIGVGQRRETAALGETPNIAARTQTIAPPGGMAITAATHRLVSDYFVTSLIGNFALKGLQQSIKLYQVREAIGLRHRERRQSKHAFVGREEELDRLRDAWALAEQGNGQVVVLRGEAGIGKSRLVRRFAEQLRERRHSWLENHCSPFSRVTPFAPVIESLSRLFRKGDKSTRPGIARLQRALTKAGFDGERAVSVVAEMLNIPHDAGYQPSLISPEQKRRRFIAIIGEWFLNLSRLQPVVCVTEDLQWADPSTLELIEYIVARCQSFAVLLIYTARSEFRPSWLNESNQQAIELHGLSPVKTIELLKKLHSEAPLSQEALQAVVERSNGVPLFAEELASFVRENGANQSQLNEIPATIADSLMARLDRLGPAREIAQVAAVVGRDFSYQIMLALTGGDSTDLDAKLRSLIDADLVAMGGPQNDRHYTFKHGLIRDTAYESLLRARRRALHGAVAQVLSNSDDHQSTGFEVVAHHLTEAGDAPAAIRAWQKAGEHAAARGALVESSIDYERAADLLPQIPASDERDQREISIMMTRASLLSAVKGLASPEAENAYQRARELGSRLYPNRANALLGLWQMHVTRGEALAAQELAEQRLKIAEREGNRASLCWSHLAVGMTLFHRGRLAGAVSHLREAINNYDERESNAAFDSGPLAMSYLAVALALQGDIEGALAQQAASVAIARGLNRAPTVAFCTLNSAALHWILNEPQQTLDIAREGTAFAREHGLPQFAAGLEVYRGWACALLGNDEDSIEIVRAAIAGWLANGQRLPYAWYLSILAGVCLIKGTASDAEEIIEAADNAIGEMQLEQVFVHFQRAEILTIKETELSERKAAWDRAIDSARASGAQLFVTRGTIGIAKMLAANGAIGEARDRLKPLMATAEAGAARSDWLAAKRVFGDSAGK